MLPPERRYAGAVHAPDESFALHSLEWGEAAARELYLALVSVPRRGG